MKSAMFKCLWLVILTAVFMSACLSMGTPWTDKDIKRDGDRKFKVVTYLNLYLKSDEDFKAYVMKEIKGTDYIDIKWEKVERIHQTYIGWAHVYYEKDGS